jgi:hypothetical protein
MEQGRTLESPGRVQELADMSGLLMYWGPAPLQVDTTRGLCAVCGAPRSQRAGATRHIAA